MKDLAMYRGVWSAARLSWAELGRNRGGNSEGDGERGADAGSASRNAASAAEWQCDETGCGVWPRGSLGLGGLQAA